MEKVLKKMAPAQVVEEIKKSGLRGRGGRGFSAGMKWELAAKVPTVDESCGKSSLCRIGGKQMLNLLDKINKGKGTKADLEQLRKIASAMQKASLCGLGQTAPNPVLSTLKFYEKEYLDKLVDAEEK